MIFRHAGRIRLRGLHTTRVVRAVNEARTPPSPPFVTASRHPFAEQEGGGAAKKEPERKGDPNDPGSRPRSGPFSKPVEADAPKEPPKEQGEEHHHPELRTRTGPHSSPVIDDAPSPLPPSPSTAATPAPPPPKEVVKAPATGPSSSPPAPERPEHLAIPPLPPPIYHGPQHEFDTYKFVTRLENAHVPEPSARALMEGVRGMLGVRSRRARETMLSRQEMDNEDQALSPEVPPDEARRRALPMQAYRFKAALSALRTEISVKARSDSTAMRAASTALQREVEALDRRMTDSLQSLRHDIDLELNTRKDDTRAGMKAFDIAAEEINNKFTISVGSLRTEIESAKWEATRRAIAIIVTLVICGVAISTATSTLTTGATPPPLPKVEPVPEVKPVREYKDAGVGTEDEGHFDDDLEELHGQLDELLDKGWPTQERSEKEKVDRNDVDRKKNFPERI